MKFLYLGDPHTQISNLADSGKLLTFVAEQAREHCVDAIVILGDLLHTHAVVRLEVLDFWRHWLQTLSANTRVIVLVGNHDMTGDHNSRLNSLRVLRDINPENLWIVEDCMAFEGFGFVSYEHDAEKFVRIANRLSAAGAHTLICHQSFSGSKFENGYFDPHGINPDLLQFDRVISGHIHLGQEFGKVWHPGTAMWLTASDANQEKGIHIVTHDADGTYKLRQTLSTREIVTPIVSLQWREGQPRPEVSGGAKATIELIGTSEWVAENKVEFKGQSIKSTITNLDQALNRNPGKSLEDFLINEFDLMSGVDREAFASFVKELKLVGDGENS